MGRISDHGTVCPHPFAIGNLTAVAAYLGNRIPRIRREETDMKAQSLFTASLAMALGSGLAIQPAQARDYPWCVNHRGCLDCSYVTYRQCQDSASGVGICEANPRTAFRGQK